MWLSTYLHLLKAQCQCTLGKSSGDEASGLEESSAACGAVVVAVGDGNPRQAYLVERPLTPGGAAKHIANILY